jgi:hypothetical protein
LFRWFGNGSVTSLEELAHVIAQSAIGPRGAEPLLASKRDEFDNIIVLCPTCHTLVDKAPDQYSVTTLLEWKERHQTAIASLFRAPTVATRREGRALAEPRLSENKSIFDEYGPHSKAANNATISDAATTWQRLVRSKVIPNNRYLAELFARNRTLLGEVERGVVAQFLVHQEAFEFNHIGADKSAAAPLFPPEAHTLFMD